MRSKTILLTCILFLVLAGVIAATAGTRWWKSPPVPVVEKQLALPPASVEFGRILEQFRVRDTAMDISGTIHIYDQERDGLLKETRPFRFVRKGEGYVSQLSCIRTYCDGKRVLVVDTLNRDIQIYKYEVAGPQADLLAKMSPQLLFSDTARLKLSGSVQQLGAERILAVHSDYSPEIKVYRIYYDTASYRPQRMEIEWWKDRSGMDTTSNRIWLAKVDYTYRRRSGLDIGSEMRSYVTIGPDGVKPTARYADFHVTVNF